MRWRKTGLLSLLALIVVAALVAACGGDDDSTGAAGSTSAGTTEAGESEAPSSEEEATGSPIKLGAIWDYEGAQLTFTKEFRAGMLAAEGEINSSGGVNGQPIEFDVCDTHEDPKKAPLCMQQFQKDEVVAVVGASILWGPAGMPQFAKSGIPNLTIPNDPTEWESPNAFPLLGGGVASYAAQAKYFAEQGVKKAAIIAFDLPLTRSLVNAVYVKKLKAEGIEAKLIPLKLGAADLTPYVTEAQDFGAEVVFSVLDNATAIRAMQAGRGGGDSSAAADDL